MESSNYCFFLLSLEEEERVLPLEEELLWVLGDEFLWEGEIFDSFGEDLFCKEEDFAEKLPGENPEEDRLNG